MSCCLVVTRILAKTSDETHKMSERCKQIQTTNDSLKKYI